MKTVAELVQWLEDFAPSRLAEPWDNVGLLWGDPAASVGRLMTCLTVTRITAAEAVAEQADLIVSHHPVLFRAVQRIRADLPVTAPLWILARAGIAVASPHTAFDSTAGGINDGLCRRLGLVDVVPLRPLAAPAAYKIVVFTPQPDRQAVLAGAFEAGAGRIGAYTECSFAIPGQGTFFGTEEANPTVGQKGRRETAEELRLEIICPAARLAAVLEAIRRNTPTKNRPSMSIHSTIPSRAPVPAASVVTGRPAASRSSPSSSRGLLATSLCRWSEIPGSRSGAWPSHVEQVTTFWAMPCRPGPMSC